MAQRRRISQKDKERLVRAFEEQDLNYLALADTLAINRSTARSIITRYLREGRIEEQPCGGCLNVRFDADMTRCIQRIVDEDCTLSLRAINTELQRRIPQKPQVHERTIGKHLDGMLYLLKLSQILPADHYRPDVIEGRHKYANWFLEEENIHHPVFIDECGFNIWTARSQGRARVGECAYHQVCGRKGRNITICLAVSQVFGLVHHTIQMGGMTRESFTEFLAGTATTLMKMKLNISFSMEHQHIADLTSQETTYICVYCHHTHHS
ncbi:Cyclin-dependent kinase-like 2 [Paramuricea clavata]|uniref:Cyclin-dependent kinase-like 2 n=1 Tax=Paramuricea clavata TaxID=317549 RepID=A0A7D9DYL0_PARCT|nr:Cyclin-dependent kinase-like 2 [Paramuricea clavata]